MAFKIKATQGKGTSISHKSAAKTEAGARQAFKRRFPGAKISSVKKTGRSKSTRGKKRGGIDSGTPSGFW